MNTRASNNKQNSAPDGDDIKAICDAGAKDITPVNKLPTSLSRRNKKSVATPLDRRKKVPRITNELNYGQDKITSQHYTIAQDNDKTYYSRTDDGHEDRGNNLCC